MSGVKALLDRGISAEAIARMGIYTGRQFRDGVRRDDSGDVIVFPFFDHEEVVAEKYRRQQGEVKKIWQKPGGRRTFWNVNALDHPALREDKALVVVEGEPDLLTVLSAGYEHVVSVPDGAPPAFGSHGEPLPAVPHSARFAVIDGDDKFSYLQSTWHRLKGIKKIVLFVDGDAPGQRLRDELALRLGRVRCLFVTYPKGCKDANEVRQMYGARAVQMMIDQATPMPIDVRLLDEIDDSYELPPVYSTGWTQLDDVPGLRRLSGGLLMLPASGFVTLLGRPGDGKSTWAKQLAVQLAKLHGWHVMLAAFEEPPGFLKNSIRTHYLEKSSEDWTITDKARAKAWMDRYFCVLAPRASDEGDETDIDWLLEKMQEAMGRYGSNVFIIDPWNEIEHKRRRDETLTEYTGRAIRALKQFAAINSALVIVAVHPTKEGGRAGGDMSLYDADGSAHWVNKCDAGLVIVRDKDGRTRLCIRKVRYRRFGVIGDVALAFDTKLEAFY